MSSWHSYPSIFNFGHRAISQLLDRDVIVEEKVDGSQISFGVFDDELMVRSKGAVMVVDAPEKMFANGVEYIKSIQHLLRPDWCYRGEYLKKPKHNALAYDRIPQNHIIIFDIERDEQDYLSPEEKRDEAHRIGLECVSNLSTGRIDSIEKFRSYLDIESVLGGQKIEGVVVKPLNYDYLGLDKKCLMGKFVSEAFKEVHAKTWGENNPKGKDIIGLIGGQLNTQARWQKAVQHLSEAGKLENSPRDIGLLMKEIPEDIRKECEEEIKQQLFDWAWPSIRRMVAGGCPQWYKELLLKQQFEREEDVPAYREEKWLLSENHMESMT